MHLTDGSFLPARHWPLVSRHFRMTLEDRQRPSYRGIERLLWQRRVRTSA